ncbi:serine hydrolase domain-containing protein [Psychroflexus sediminis]|uniref:CubicO group peptidase, beta-lactamase class C family n=1 Tax=Psychroflexus sediminis TaxID=470826 RepID=A0A1G7U004_9FLAO|nr:serine hydrolase domain-containing protein [Psychroflexus sediminis]SDG40863.1 CubicO group peptidase, beta-lactamase class C family [Psychroflexus sediminis]
MKFNSKFFFRLMLFATLALIISYTMFQNFAFSNFETYAPDTSEILEFKPKASVPDYTSLFSDEIEVLKEEIQEKAKRYRINGSVLIAYKDQILYEDDFGYKDPTKKTPMEPALSYQLASVSKQFTAAAVLKLHENKLLDIDYPVSRYLPNFKFEKVSIRDLLKHRSGLWNYMYLTEQYWDQDIAPDNLEVVDLLNTHAPRLNFPSGRYFSYSNTGYVVLGAIVEQVTQLSLKEYIREEFLLPLCLDETFVEKTELNKKSILNGYQPYRRSFIELPAGYHNNAIGDKGIYASAKDLHIWFRDLKNGKILREESVDLMFGRDKGGENRRYGMGFRLENKGNEPVIFHNGLWDGFRNGLVYYPKSDLVVIVMTHTQNKRKHYFQKQIIKKAKAQLRFAEKRVELKTGEPELVL